MKTLFHPHKSMPIKIFTCFIIAICFCGQLKAQLKLDFAESFGGSGWDYVKDMVIDASGNIYMVGAFENTVDFDPGADIYNVTSAGIGDAYILKLDGLGNFLWVYTIGNDEAEAALSIDVDAAGNVIAGGYVSGGIIDFDNGPGVTSIPTISNYAFIIKIDGAGNFQWVKLTEYSISDLELDEEDNIISAGQFIGTNDMDPGTAEYYISSSGVDVYVQKLDADGNFLWAVSAGSLYDEGSSALSIDHEGNIIVYGFFNETVDFDPGAGVFNLSSTGQADFFVWKLDQAGNFMWADAFGSMYDNDTPNECLAIDEENNILVSGDFYGSIDFDPGPGVVIKTTSAEDVFMLKLNASGNFIWVKATHSNDLGSPYSITTDSEGNIFSAGQFNGELDLDPGPGIFLRYSLEGWGYDMFLQKLDSDGNFIWGVTFENADGVIPMDLLVNTEGKIYCAGYGGTLDLDPGASTTYVNSSGIEDIYICRYSEAECANLTAVLDTVANASCTEAGLAIAHGTSGVAPYAYQWITDPIIYDSIASFPTNGYYDLLIIDSLACAKTTTILINGPSTTSDVDAAVNLIYPGFSPGMPTAIQIDAFNDGCLATSGDIKLKLDQLLTFDDAVPAPDATFGDTLIWHYTNMAFDSVHKMITVNVTTSTAATLTSIVDLYAAITNTGTDMDTTNNQVDDHDNVVGSYDPNDKNVYPGVCDAGYVTHDQTLTYTVRFQNTGTAEALNVFILDTLSTRLNRATMRVLASSHEMHTEYLTGDVVKFVFDNIHLPDSSTNEAESHGYVIFEIKSKPSAPDYAVVSNSAAIYFDFNDPIITNATINTLVDEVPEAITFSQNLSVCDGEGVTVGDTYYTEPGIYTDYFRTTNGCDSIVTTNLSIVPAYDETVDATICNGESLVINGNNYSAAGSYEILLSTIYGCDSIIHLNLTVNDTAHTDIAATICSGESYAFNGDMLTDAGTYTMTLASALGCDSSITLDLSVTDINAAVEVTETQLSAVQTGATYQWLNCISAYSVIPGAVEQTYAPPSYGYYAVVISLNSCSDTSKCIEFETLAIDDMSSQNSLSVYPNPARDLVYIVLNASKVLQTDMVLQLFDITGKQVYTQVVNDDMSRLDVRDLSPGIYMLRIEAGNETFGAEKLVIE